MTDTMKVEVLEETGIKDGPYNLAFEDVVTVPGVYGQRWTALGWTRCVKSGECGERIPGSRVINKDGTLGAATKVIQPDDQVTPAAQSKAQ